MHKIWFLSVSVSSQYFKSLNPLRMKNIAYIGSWKHFVFVFVCVLVSLSLYLSFCKSLSWSLSSPDDRLIENILFAWTRTLYNGDRWRCHQPREDRATQQWILNAEFCNEKTKSLFRKVRAFPSMHCLDLNNATFMFFSFPNTALRNGSNCQKHGF